MATTTAKGLLIVVFLGTMSMMASADHTYPDDAATKEIEKEESRFLFGTADADTSVVFGNEALLLIPLAFLGLLLLGALVAALFGIGGAEEYGPTGYGHDSYSTYDVYRSGLDHGYQALEKSSYQVARSLAEAAKKYL